MNSYIQLHIRSQPTPETILVSHIPKVISHRQIVKGYKKKNTRCLVHCSLAFLASSLCLRNKKRWTSEATGIVSLTGPSTAGIDPCASHWWCLRKDMHMDISEKMIFPNTKKYIMLRETRSVAQAKPKSSQKILVSSFKRHFIYTIKKCAETIRYNKTHP